VKFGTDLLARFVQSTGRTVSRDSLQAFDPALYAGLVPVVSVPGPLGKGGANLFVTGAFPDARAPSRESFSANENFFQNAATAFFVRVIPSFGRGLWDITVSAGCLTDYNGTDNLNSRPYSLRILSEQGPGIESTLWQAWAQAGVPQFLQPIRFQMLFPDDTFGFTTAYCTTIAAQSFRTWCTIIANRLS
jgi:hypothetical protein